jgi:broad specificity phosphatase PhoE
VIRLVRHAPPAATPDAPPPSWPLTPEGRTLAAALVPALPADALLFSSPEPKAWQTLEPAAAAGPVPRPVVHDPRFGEVRRPPDTWAGGWRAERQAYVAGTLHPGWEPQADVAARFDAGLDAALAAAGGSGPGVVVASHGMAITCWLVSRGIVAAADAAEFWSTLRQPDLLAVDLGAGTWRRDA